jgi:UDP-glucose 4-epimerase
MNILLTGGAGYIGSHTLLALVEKGHSVTTIDNLITGNKDLIPKEVNFFNSDISDKDKINFLLKKNKFDVVMHFAGLVKVEESLKYPEKYNLYNFEKAKIFFDCCFKFGIDKIIFSSTAGIYGKLKELRKVHEEDKLQPSNPYALSKYHLEKYLLNLSNQKKIKSIILRYFNVAGADQKKRSGLFKKDSNNLIKAVCEVATKKRDKIIINGNDYKTNDGTPVRDFIHVSDLAEIHLLAAENINLSGKTGIYNCGYGSGYSVKEVIQEMEKILKHDLKKELGPRRKDDIPYSVSDSKKFREKFNWRPKHNDLNYILRSALEWEKKLT